MQETRFAISLKLPTPLIQRLDELRISFPAEASRTACIEAAIEEWLKKHERKK